VTIPNIPSRPSAIVGAGVVPVGVAVFGGANVAHVQVGGGAAGGVQAASVVAMTPPPATTAPRRNPR
jgi:hypothetical protein